MLESALDAGPDERLPVWWGPRWVLGTVLAVALLLTALTAWFLAYERQERRALALHNAALHARLLTDLVDRGFDTVQVTLRSVAEGLDPSGVWEGDSQRLTQAVRSLSFLRSLHVVDGDGRVLASSNEALLGQRIDASALGPAPTAGRWRVPAVLAGRDLLDARPLNAEPARRLVVPVVMALAPAEVPAGGRGNGTRLVAVVNPDHFATQFELLLKETQLSAALMQIDLRVLASTEALALPLGLVPPSPQALHSALLTKPYDQRLAQGLTGRASVFAHRSSRLAPWVVAVETPLAAVDAAFHTLATQTLAAWLVGMGLLGAVAGFGLHSLRAFERQRLARLAARRDLQRQHVLTANLIAASATALYAKDAQGRLLMANQAWGQLAGGDAMRGQPLPASAWLADPSSPDRPDADLLARGGLETFEVRLDTPAGARDMLVSKAAVRDEQGEVVALVGSLTDVSALREAERRSREAAVAAQQANAAKTAFVANMSHELRTPLQSILGFSEIGLKRCGDIGPAHTYFQRVNDAGQHMLTLVEDLLTLAKPELQDLPLTLVDLGLAPLVAEVLEQLAVQAQRKGIHLQADLPDASPRARVERRGFQQVVRNLVANALRFAPEGSVVEVALRADGPCCRLTVSDRGPGIPADELEAVFAPFVQSSSTQTQAGGTGLGLAICRRFVVAFGGQVWAESRSGGGVVFVVSLPRL